MNVVFSHAAPSRLIMRGAPNFGQVWTEAAAYDEYNTSASSDQTNLGPNLYHWKR